MITKDMLRLRLQASTGLLPNYLGEQTFSDSASTALMAATSYRMAQLGLDNSSVASADIARRAVFANVNTTTGWLSPVVDSTNWAIQASNSSEAQSFVIILSAAYRDYQSVTGSVAAAPVVAKSAASSTIFSTFPITTTTMAAFLSSVACYCLY